MAPPPALSTTAASCPTHPFDRDRVVSLIRSVALWRTDRNGQQSTRGDRMSDPSRPRKRARRRLLVGGTVLTAVVARIAGVNGATAAPVAAGCVVSIGVTQTATVVTGSLANDTIDCGGATSGKIINGNLGNDTITGTAFIDTINGDLGNDTLTGAIGNDILNGGLGNDTMTGSAGNDVLVGGPGNDTMTGSEGDDTLKGEGNSDTLNGGVGNDNLDGGTGTDLIHGDAGNDTLTGPPEDLAVDTLDGGAGTDVCQAGGVLIILFRDSLTACNP
jgi:Ca2+-binding RTX toxin-like protein